VTILEEIKSLSNRVEKIIIVLSILFLSSCGTGPWFINKKIYQTYKENIYASPIHRIKTNGYYLQVGALHPRISYRDILIFYENGYSISFRLKEKELQSEIKNKITQNKDTIVANLNWWKIYGDSLSIEHYAETKRDMVTWNYYRKGRTLNDTLIELKYRESYPPVKFRFVQTDALPKVINKGRYLKKNWYIDQLNTDRKATAHHGNR